jgi:hypothetical protein
MDKQILKTSYSPETLFDFKKQMLDALLVFNCYLGEGAETGPNYTLAKHSIAYIRKFMSLPCIMDSEKDEIPISKVVDEVRYFMSLLRLKKEILQNGHLSIIKADKDNAKPCLNGQEQQSVCVSFYDNLMEFFKGAKKDLSDELKVVQVYADFLQDESLWNDSTIIDARATADLSKKLGPLARDDAARSTKTKALVVYELIHNPKVSKDTKRRFRDIMVIRKRALEDAISWVDERLSIYEKRKESVLKSCPSNKDSAKNYQKENLDTQSEIGRMLEKARHDLSIYTYGLKLLRGDILEELYLGF